METGDGRHLEKSKNRHTSATIESIATKFDTLTQFDPLDHSISKIGPHQLHLLCSLSKHLLYRMTMVAYLNFIIKQQIYA